MPITDKITENIKAILVIAAIIGATLTGKWYFAPTSELKAMETAVNQRIAGVERGFKEYTTRQTISQIKDAMRKLEDRNGTDNPLMMVPNDREDYRQLMDELEYYKGILDDIKGEG